MNKMFAAIALFAANFVSALAAVPAEYEEKLKAAEDGQLGILTPAPSAAPRINGAKVFGVCPGHPILWRMPVTGVRSMRLAAKGLPPGAEFDAETGILSGAVSERGTYPVTFTAENAAGRTSGVLKLVVGDKIALTPPGSRSATANFTSIRTARSPRRKSRRRSRLSRGAKARSTAAARCLPER